MALIVPVAVSPLWAGAVLPVTYQGKLLESGVVADGTFDFQFELYDSEVDGAVVDSQLINGVSVVNGVFSVLLQFSDAELFIADRWLAVTVTKAGQSTELTPRSLLTGTPLALRADVADQAALADLATLTDVNSVNGSSVVDASISAADIDSTAIQLRVAAECVPGQSIRAVGQDGTVTCELDDTGVQSVIAGVGLIGSGSTDITLDLDTATIQVRVTGTCGANEAIQSIDSNGNVFCEVDDNTNAHNTAHAGYDVAPSGIGVITTALQNVWDFTAGSHGDGSVVLAGGERILVTVGTYVYKSDLDATTAIRGEILPCYSTSSSFTPLNVADFPGKSRFQVQSTGLEDQSWVQASYLFTGLGSGTRYFTLCIRRTDLDVAAADFALYAPKVDVLTFP